MTHLALGDYVYQGAFLHQLKIRYPNIKLDIWIDDCRTKQKSWHNGRNSTLQQWLANESHIDHIYPIAESNQSRDDMIKLAQQQEYDYIVFVATNRAASYLDIAKRISEKAVIAGTEPQGFFTKLINQRKFSKVNPLISLDHLKQSEHISDFYNHIFSQLFASPLEKSQRLRRITFPQKFTDEAKAQIAVWRNSFELADGPTVFINHLSTNDKRDWQLIQVKELMQALAKDNSDILFILNAPPHKYQEISKWCNLQFEESNLVIAAFSATKNFFQLPALMQTCDLTISVETAIMHLASSLKLSQIALIRKSASRWCPLGAEIVLKGDKRVDRISVSQVIKEAQKCLKKGLQKQA